MLRRGQALLGLGRHVEAAKCLEKVKILEPQNEEAKTICKVDLAMHSTRGFRSDTEVAAALRRAQVAATQKRGKFDFRPMLAEATDQKID